MAADRTYYGASIPGNFTQTFYEVINEFIDSSIDNQMARRLLTKKPVPDTTEEYAITKVDFSTEEVVPKARSAAPENITMGAGEDFYRIYRWPTGFTLNEQDLAKHPALQSWHVQACTSKIYRAEDKAFYSGHAGTNITGFKTASEANTNGKIVASGASGSDTNNNGAWLTSDTSRDIYEDVRVARGKLDPKYRAKLNQLYLVGNPDSMDALWQKDPYSDGSTTIAESVAPLLGRSKTASPVEWAIVNDQIADGYVFLICKDPQAAELVVAKEITIDDRYPMQPIGNFQIAIYQDMGIAIHDNNAFVEIVIT